MKERIAVHGFSSRPDSIGESCFTIDLLVQGITRRLMIDCGMEFERRGSNAPRAEVLPDLSLLNDGKKIDALLLSHFHTDHVGAVAWLIDQGYLDPDAKIVASQQTFELLTTVLLDGHRNHPEDILGVVEAISSERQLAILKPGEIQILPGLKAYAVPVGHAPGAYGFVIPTSTGKVFFTGDMCFHDQPIVKSALRPAEWSKEWLPDSFGSTDLTYGAWPRIRTIGEEVKRFQSQVLRAISEGKTIIVPSFGNGRGQNCAVWLSELGLFRDHGVVIWLDGVTKPNYDVFRDADLAQSAFSKLPKLGEESGIFAVEGIKDRGLVMNSPRPKVVITTAGMGDFGPVLGYMRRWLGDSEACFFFVSYLAPESNGAKLVGILKKRENERQLFLETNDGWSGNVPVRAEIDSFGLSAHSDLNELVEYVAEFVALRGGEPLDRIILAHGTRDTKTAAAIRLQALADEIIHAEKGTKVTIS